MHKQWSYVFFALTHRHDCHGISTVTTWLFVQQLVQTHIQRNNKPPHYWPFMRGNPLVISGFPSKRASNVENIAMRRHHCGSSALINFKVSCIPSESIMQTARQIFHSCQMTDLQCTWRLREYTRLINFLFIKQQNRLIDCHKGEIKPKCISNGLAYLLYESTKQI